MRFSGLAAYLDQLEATRSRNELVRILSELYGACSVDEIEPVTYLIQGRLAPFFAPVEMGLGERLLVSAIAMAYGIPKDDVSKLNRQVGDVGLTALRLAPKTVSEPPSIVEVHRRLFEIAGASGTGSLGRKLELFAGLLGDLDPASAKHLVRITAGKIRLGIGDPTVLDALSFAKRGDRSLRPVLEAAYNRTSDLGLIARTLWAEGEGGLDALEVTVGKPLRSQLAERLPNPESVIRKLGMVGVQPKYDGLRVQIHRSAEQVSIFSRNLETMTSMFPELVAAANRLQVESVILDGEAIAYNPESEEYVPFQETTARRRKEGIEEFALRVPLRAFVFDVMYRDGSDLTPLPYEKRLEVVNEVLEDSDTLLPAPLTRTDSVEVLTRELLDNISRGLEGVVEVLADEITPSPRHTAGKVGDQPGFALRFPRIVSFRSADKKPEDATTVREIREMFQQQHQRQVRQ